MTGTCLGDAGGGGDQGVQERRQEARHRLIPRPLEPSPARVSAGVGGGRARGPGGRRLRRSCPAVTTACCTWARVEVAHGSRAVQQEGRAGRFAECV